jgi:opacity protein-like surface antigen
MKGTLFGCLVVSLLLVSGAAARADQRNYVWTYEYHTLAKDSAEIEFYQTAVTKDKQVQSASDWTQQVELEYGITDHFDAALYEVYEQPAGGVMQYAGYKIRLRYRIAEKNALPLDVLLYAEHVENTGEENEFEGKVILAKDIGKLNIAYNQIFEKEYRSGSGAGHEYAAGVSYELSPQFRIGLESKGSYKEDTYAAGPTVAWSGSRIWANIGAAYGLNRRTSDREVRFLLGIPF